MGWVYHRFQEQKCSRSAHLQLIWEIPYKLFEVVTNRDLAGDKGIWWSRERCGKGEEMHAIMKNGPGRWTSALSPFRSQCDLVIYHDLSF